MNKPSLAALPLIFGIVFGCSSDDKGSGAEPHANAGTPPVVIGFSGNTGTGGRPAGTGGGAATSCQPARDASGCVGEQYEGETVPLDVYVMFDQSCSMSCPISRSGPGQCCMGDPNGRIIPVRQAMDLFLHDPQSAGIGFGLGYFGNMEIGDTSCTPSDYEKPAIAIATGKADAIAASLDRAEPTGETPTGAAIRGACTYVRDAKRSRSGRSIAILLVTDGIPETPASNCGASLADAVDAARECALDPASPTKIYVLGVGQALQNLNQIAEAGRTEKAYLVEGGDVAKSMVMALNAIRGAATIPCELQIPDPPTGEALDYGRVNIGICDAAGAVQETYNVVSASKCGSGVGWYYDNPANPQKIMLCKASCDIVSVAGAELHYSVGCMTRVPVR